MVIYLNGLNHALRESNDVRADFQPIEVTPRQLIGGTRTMQGWSKGTAIDAEDTLRFAELTGVRPMIETYPLEKAANVTLTVGTR